MSRYYLVGSYYDIYNKSYTNEHIIYKIDGISLSSIDKIDNFTSSHSKGEILKMLEDDLGIKGINHLSIKYSKSDSDFPVYYKLIDNNKMFNDCVNSCIIKEANQLNSYRRTLVVSLDNELFKEELKLLLDIISKKDYQLFRSVYSKENYFSFLVKSYINSCYDNELYEEEDLKKIVLEFSIYMTFRSWIVSKQISGKIKKSSKPVKKFDNNKQNIGVSSIDNCEKEYEERFYLDKGITYNEYMTNQFNNESEEFLDEDEYSSMNEYSKKKY